MYDNLKKTILFVMPTNLAQGLLIVIALLAGNVLPLTPVLILWMNMATSATLSFGLAFEAGEKNIMRRPPRDPKIHVMDGFAIWRVAFVGVDDCGQRIYSRSLAAAARAIRRSLSVPCCCRPWSPPNGSIC